MISLITWNPCSADSIATAGLSAHRGEPYPETWLERIGAVERHGTVETAGSNNSQKMLSARLSPMSSDLEQLDLGQNMKIPARSSDSAVAAASETQNASETSSLPKQLQVHHQDLREVNCQQICRLPYEMLKHQHTDTWGQASSVNVAWSPVCSRLEDNLDTAPCGPIKPSSDVTCNSPGTPTVDEQWSGTTLDCRQDFQSHMVTGQLSKPNFLCDTKHSGLEHFVIENCLLNDTSSFFAKERNNIHDACSGHKMGCSASAPGIATTSVDDNESDTGLNCICSGLEVLGLSIGVKGNSDNCSGSTAALVRASSSNAVDSAAGNMMTQKTSAFSTGQEKQLSNSVAVEDGSEWLASPRHLENSGESSKAFLEKMETLAEAVGHNVNRNPLESRGSPEGDCQLHGQQNMELKVTSTPVKQEGMPSPAASFTLEILEGSYAGNCCHRDGSQLSKLNLFLPFPKLLSGCFFSCTLLQKAENSG